MTRRTAIIPLASGILFGFVFADARAQEARAGEKPRGFADHPAKSPLRMSTAVVCDTIDGYEDYTPLKGASLTSDEKLLVYFRPVNYKIESKGELYLASFNEDAQIRRRGAKQVILRKDKLLEYTAKSTTPPVQVYLKNQLSLKGLEPGEYDLTIILTDKLDGGSTSQVVKFKVVAAKGGAKSPDDESTTESVDSDTAAPQSKP